MRYILLAAVLEFITLGAMGGEDTLRPKDNATPKSKWTVYTGFPFDEKEAKRRQEETAKALEVAVEQEMEIAEDTNMRFILIPAGEFMMGSEDGKDDEKPVHKVVISQPFLMGKYEVTNAEYRKFNTTHNSNVKEWRDSWLNGKRQPVVRVSWIDAKAFCVWLNRKKPQGWEYRLPTEAQWEYACRAGSSGKHYYGDDEKQMGQYAWFYDNNEDQSHVVGGKKPNAWGLHDMLGNAAELCEDWYEEDYYKKSPGADPQGPVEGTFRLMRGGSWLGHVTYSRAADRELTNPEGNCGSLGLRVALVPSP